MPPLLIQFLGFQGQHLLEGGVLKKKALISKLKEFYKIFKRYPNN